MKKKKLAIVTYSLVAGGTEKITAFIANHISSDVYDITLILFTTKNQVWDIKDGISIIDLNRINSSKGIIKLYCTLVKLKPDIIFSTLTVTNVIVSLIKPFFFFDCKFILRESTILSVNNERLKNKFLYNGIIKLIYPSYDKIIAQSDDMIIDLIKNYKVPRKKIVKINNPITNSRGITTKILNCDHPTFITIGNLRPEKGYDRMIEVISKLKFDFTYYIIGDGEMRRSVEDAIKRYNLSDKIIITGRISNTHDYLKKADIYLQASYYEGFPNALLEAIECGLPAIAYHSPGGTSEIIIDGENGF
ncbi:MAG: glycosyltransferase [Saprospiraceae bacterium]|nr:glycosyltransferase [Saprospiraceae bacterium]